MFSSRQRGTVIAKGLKIVGSVTAEGLVEVNGQIDGELHCTSLVIARPAEGLNPARKHVLEAVVVGGAGDMAGVGAGDRGERAAAWPADVAWPSNWAARATEFTSGSAPR